MMESFLNDVWDAVRPALLTLIAGLAPVLATIITAKVVAALKVSKDGELAQSLYRTIENSLKALIATKSGQTPSILFGVPNGVVADAIALVKRNNPKAVSALDQADERLKTEVAPCLGTVARRYRKASSSSRVSKLSDQVGALARSADSLGQAAERTVCRSER